MRSASVERRNAAGARPRRNPKGRGLFAPWVRRPYDRKIPPAQMIQLGRIPL
jgi:hypothetical protein